MVIKWINLGYMLAGRVFLVVKDPVSMHTSGTELILFRSTPKIRPRLTALFIFFRKNLSESMADLRQFAIYGGPGGFFRDSLH